MSEDPVSHWNGFDPIDEKDWCAPIIQNLIQQFSTVIARMLKKFTIVKMKLYFRGSVDFPKEELQRIRNLFCGDNYLL